MDDYEIAFDSRAEAEAGLVRLETALAHFELAINPRKTSIDPLPQLLEADWIHSLREYDFDLGDLSTKDLLRYFHLVFSLHHNRLNEPVIPYAVGRLRTEEVEEDVWPLFQELLFQCALAEPAALQSVFAQLTRHSQLGFSSSLPTMLDKIIQAHSVLGHSSEVSWALWTAIWFDLPLSAGSAAALAGNDDPIVGLLALHARDKALFKGNLDVTAWEKRLTRDELYDRNWLLVYESLQKEWLPVPKDGNPVDADDNFKQLKAENVSFYDVKPSATVELLVEVTEYGGETVTIKRSVPRDFDNPDL